MEREELSCGNLELVPSRFQYFVGGVEKSASVFLFNLLKYFVLHQGRVISRAELIDQVWGGSVSNDRIVDAHIVSLRKTLKNFNGTFRTVYGAGYMLSKSETKRMQGRKKTKARNK